MRHALAARLSAVALVALVAPLVGVAVLAPTPAHAASRVTVANPDGDRKSVV